jgi:hypothetical protein
VIDCYGQGERTCLAVGVNPGEYKFLLAYGHVELMIQPIDADESDVRKARIVGAGYWNPAMPLVRYDTGDSALVPVDTSEADLLEIAAGRPNGVLSLGITVRASRFR